MMRVRSLWSLVLRLAGVGGKFVVTFVLAREVGARAVGEFALFFGAVNLLVFVIGLDLHLFSIREMLLRRSAAGRLRVMVGQLQADAGLYVIFIAGALAIYVSGIADRLPISMGWLVAITVADHLAQELSRAFQMLRRAYAANIVFAVKSGLWGWIGSALLLGGVTPPSVEPFYALWLAFDVAAIVGGMFVLHRMMKGVPASRPHRALSWYRRGISVSRFYYATSVSTMGIAYIDRFVIAGWMSVAEAGVYAFWQSIASLLPTVTFAMAGMHSIPVLVESYKRKRSAEFKEAARAFFRHTIVLCLLAGLAVLAVSAWIPPLLGQPGMAVSWSLVLVLLSGAAGNALWQVPYQVLYSAGEDRFLAIALVSLSVLSTVANIMLIPLIGIWGAALVSAATNFAIYIALDRVAKQHLAADARAGQNAPLVRNPS